MSGVAGKSNPKTSADQASPWGRRRRRIDNQFPEKREALLATAASLFRTRGYSEVSLNDVADILKITKPTLYYYVQSKEQLLYDIITRGQEEILHHMRRVNEGSGTGAEKLRNIMQHYARVIISDYGACMPLMRPHKLESKYRQQIVARNRTANEIIYGILELGVKDGSLVVPEPTIVLHALFGSLNWISRWYKPTGRLDADGFITTYVDVLLHGVATDRGTSFRSTMKKGTPPNRKK